MARAHHILENMRDWMAALDTTILERPRRWHEAAMECLSDASTFEFDRYPGSAHATFGSDLLKKGLFRLPHEDTLFVCPVRSSDEDRTELVHALARMRADGDLLIAYLMRSRSSGRWGGSLDVVVTAKGGGIKYDVTHPLLAPDDQEVSDADQTNADTLVGLCFAFVSALISKDYVTTREAPPTRLNAARAQKGKPAINEVAVIRLRPGVKYMPSDEAGTHASPRMHWRRGHYRTLHRGEDGQRVIPVAPALIGASEAARESIPAPKDYLVRSA